MPVIKLLGGLRRFGGAERQVTATSVREALRYSGVPKGILFPGADLNHDIEVLVNGRNIAFLAGLATPLATDDRVTIFPHGARGYPGG